MTSTLVLSAMSILACGYIIYDAPICRHWWSRYVGYVLYFRIIVTGLFLVLLLTLLLERPPLRGFDLTYTRLGPEHVPILAFVLAISLRILAKIYVWSRGKLNPEWLSAMDLKNLNHKGLDQIIYNKIRSQKMIMVTLQNNKVYTGWPVEAPNNEDDKWLRLVPQWSGYRDKRSRVHVQIDYSKVYGQLLPDSEQMLVSVESIVTVQPFDPEVFEKFNPEPKADDSVSR